MFLIKAWNKFAASKVYVWFGLVSFLVALLMFIVSINVYLRCSSASSSPLISKSNTTPTPKQTLKRIVTHLSATPSSIEVLSPSPSPVSPTPVPVQKTYVSKDFRIRFKYMSYDMGAPVVISELDNRIYVYYNYRTSDRNSGQYVEFFYKNPNESLRQAIENQVFFNKNDLKYCKIVINKDDNYPKSYRRAIITTIVKPFSDEYYNLLQSDKDFNGCPNANLGAERFFLYDTNHPDKVLFFSIGQYFISASVNSKGEPEKFWQETVRFVD